MFPASLSVISLIQWIDYSDKIYHFDEELKQLNELQAGSRKQILLSRNYINKAFESALYFHMPADAILEDLLQDYDSFCSLFNEELPVMQLPAITEITFGHFVDLKMIMQGSDAGYKWKMLQYITASVVFPYRPESLRESSDEFILAGDVALDQALSIYKWWEDLNAYVLENYSFFQDSGEDDGANMKEHMQRWGWINFLKSIATTKVFDISGNGKNSIDCARMAMLEDVLVWASEDKDYNIAVMRDMKKN